MTEYKESSGLRVGWFIIWLDQVMQIAMVISGPSTFFLSNYKQCSDLALKMPGIIEQAVYYRPNSPWVWVGDLYKFENKNSLLQSPILISVT